MSGMGAAALALGTQGLWLPRSGLAQSASNSNLFKLGVASGDPWPNSVVLWTRLTPGDPLNGGGTLTTSTTVEWEVASDATFTTTSIVKRGTATVDPKFAHSVHAVADGLAPTTRYYYRFKNGTYTSPTGRTKTAPAASASPTSMRFALASCQHWESGYYTAYGHMANQVLDLVVHVGDYIYEGAPSGGSVLRKHSAVADPSWGCNTLTDYRNRHA